MPAPVLPLSVIASGSEDAAAFSVRRGDHGATLTFQLFETSEGTPATYPLPTGATVALVGVEDPELPVKERRVPRSIGGAAVVDGTDASLVTYTIGAGDTAHAGVYALRLVATFLTGEIVTWPSVAGVEIEIT